jgi:hypothetical protein
MLLLLVASSLLVAQQRGPRLLVVEPKFNMGFVPDSSFVTHAFWVNNIGTDSLRIFKVETTCGCTKAPIDRGVVAVNDSLPLEIIFDNANRLKSQIRPAYIVSNDPAAARYEVSFSCYVYGAGEATGPISIVKNKRLRLSTVDQGKDFVVTLKNVSKEALTPKLVTFPGELVAIDLPEGPIPAGSKADIIVHVKGDLKQKHYLKSFTIEMSDAARTRYTIPIRLAEPVAALKAYEKKSR